MITYKLSRRKRAMRPVRLGRPTPLWRTARRGFDQAQRRVVLGDARETVSDGLADGRRGASKVERSASPPSDSVRRLAQRNSLALRSRSRALRNLGVRSPSRDRDRPLEHTQETHDYGRDVVWRLCGRAALEPRRRRSG